MIAVLWYKLWDDRRLRRRLIALPVFGVCLTLLAVAASLDPDERGHGTHEQMGLPGCSVQMFSGRPCPTCGMTTSFSHAVRGQLLGAFTAQPAGALLALLTMAGLCLSAYVLATGAELPWLRGLWRWRTLIIAIVVILGAWVYKLADSGAFG